MYKLYLFLKCWTFYLGTIRKVLKKINFGYIENSAISFAYLCYASTAQPLQQFEERRTATPNIYAGRAAGKS